MSTWFWIGSGKNLDVEVFLDKMNYMPSDIKDTIGESKAVVEGFVVDRSTGKPLYGVDLKITNLDKSIKTDQKGYFYVEIPFFSALEENDEQPVRADIVFKKSGYKTYVEKNALILPDKQTMKITLEQGEGQIVKSYVHGILDESPPPTPPEGGAKTLTPLGGKSGGKAPPRGGWGGLHTAHHHQLSGLAPVVPVIPAPVLV